MITIVENFSQYKMNYNCSLFYFVYYEVENKMNFFLLKLIEVCQTPEST
jgi:hypothetical protein